MPIVLKGWSRLIPMGWLEVSHVNWFKSIDSFLVLRMALLLFLLVILVSSPIDSVVALNSIPWEGLYWGEKSNLLRRFSSLSCAAKVDRSLGMQTALHYSIVSKLMRQALIELPSWSNLLWPYRKTSMQCQTSEAVNNQDVLVRQPQSYLKVKKMREARKITWSTNWKRLCLRPMYVLWVRKM